MSKIRRIRKTRHLFQICLWVFGRYMYLIYINWHSFCLPVIWMKNDQTLQEDDHLHFLSLRDWCGLEILDALPRDEGIYTVKLENSAGSVTSSCRIEMKLPKEDLKFFHTKEEELEGFFHKWDITLEVLIFDFIFVFECMLWLFTIALYKLMLVFVNIPAFVNAFTWCCW